MTMANLTSDEAQDRPRLIFLTQFYDPEPAYKGQAFAEGLYNLGYDVEVVTGFPNYPSGKIYDGYRIRPCTKSVQNNVRITRLALYPSHNSSKLGRIANYLSFFMSAFIYLCWTARRANLVYVYHPPLTVGLAAAASRFIHRCPVIVDIHDLWPDTLPSTGMMTNQRVLRWIDRAAKWMYRRVQFIILHTEGFRKKLLERGVPETKMQTVIGWTNEYKLAPCGIETGQHLEQLKQYPGIKLLYAGNMGPAQTLPSVIDTAALLESDGKADMVTFVFLGGGIEKAALEDKAKHLKLKNVVFLPRVSHAEVGHFLDAADALLVHLKADPLFEITLPSKTQAYMYAAKPILMAVNGEAAALVKTAKAGTTAMPEDPSSIAAAVLQLCNMSQSERVKMGEAGRAYYMNELSMKKGLQTFQRIFEKNRKT